MMNMYLWQIMYAKVLLTADFGSVRIVAHFENHTRNNGVITQRLHKEFSFYSGNTKERALYYMRRGAYLCKQI
jgi:hypothetical protein